MTKYILSSLAAIAMLALASGCSTTSGSPFSSQQAAGAIKIAAEDGTVVTLLYNPMYKPGFVAATNLLSTVQATNLTDVVGLLKNLEVGGKSAPYVALAVDNAMTLLGQFNVNLQALPVSNQLAVVQLWQGAVLAGMSQGLPPQ